jgi:predicted DNA-binding protein with PD1-like motif
MLNTLMDLLPLRLSPGHDLRRALEAAVAGRHCTAAFVLSGIGSLAGAQLRLAGLPMPQAVGGDLELLSLAGTVAANGSHLHAVLAGPDGAVIGGHVAYGCTVRTTAEVLLALLPEWDFRREPDAATGYDELVARPRATPAQ